LALILWQSKKIGLQRLFTPEPVPEPLPYAPAASLPVPPGPLAPAPPDPWAPGPAAR
jgi:hypothetical protein